MSLKMDNNLEVLINRLSFELVNENILEETEINKLLGVLSNDGVYAMWVWTLDKFKLEFKNNKEELEKEKIFAFLKRILVLDKFITGKYNYDEIIGKIVSITREINRLNDEIKKLEGQEKQKKQEEKKQKEKERNQKLNEYFLNLSNDINNLLFLKQLLEKTLIYARYHAKAKRK